MKKTLLILSLLLACTFSSNAQSNATVHQTVSWINTFGISKTTGHVKDVQSISVSNDNSQINFSSYIVYENGKVKDNDKSFYLDDKYTIRFGPWNSLYQLTLKIEYTHQDSYGFFKWRYNFKDKTHAKKVINAFKHLFDLLDIEYKIENLYDLENKF